MPGDPCAAPRMLYHRAIKSTMVQTHNNDVIKPIIWYRHITIALEPRACLEEVGNHVGQHPGDEHLQIKLGAHQSVTGGQRLGQF